MQFYLCPESGPEVFFTVYDDKERPAYEVTACGTAVGRRFLLRAPDGTPAARMTAVFLPACLRCAVTDGRRHFRVWIAPDASMHRSVRLKGIPWRFRGNLSTRSFDIVTEAPRKGDASRTVMTHGRCWSGPRGSYAVEVFSASDVPLALCVAAAIDSFSQSSCTSPVPAG